MQPPPIDVLLSFSPPPCTIELRARLYPKYKPAVLAVFGHSAQLAELFYTGVRDEPNIYVLYLLRLAPRLVSLVFYCILFVLVAQWIMCFPYTYMYITGFLIKYPFFKVELYNVACKYCCCFTYLVLS